MGQNGPSLPDLDCGPVIARSRPLRALTLLLLSWVGGRASILTLGSIAPTRETAVVGKEAAELSPLPSGAGSLIKIEHTAPRFTAPVQRERSPGRTMGAPSSKWVQGPSPSVARLPSPLLPTSTPHAVVSEQEAPRLSAVDVPPLLRPRTKLQLTGSGWLLNRNGPGTPDGGNLGASQAGLRVYLPVSEQVRLTGRLSSALGQAEREAAAGLSLVMRDLPISLLVERRIGLKGGRNAFSVTAVASRYGTNLGKGWTLDAYAQAGLVGLRRRDGFADASASATHRTHASDAFEVRLGGLVSGSAQSGLARLDAGPEMILTSGQWRLSASWRQRLAGNADPGSGPGLALSTNF